MRVNVLHDSPEFKPLTHHIKDPILKSEIEELIESYQPNKTKDSGVKMKIVLTDNIPVYQSPRRLSQTDNDRVDKVIVDWLRRLIIKFNVSDYASPVALAKRKN